LGVCISIQANNVQIDCAQHTITSVSLGNVDSVLIENCTVINTLVSGGVVSNVTVTKSVLMNGWKSSSSQRLTITNNHTSGAGLIVQNGSSSLITDNLFDHLDPEAFYAVDLTNGSSNQVARNRIDGGYDGGGGQTGLDDGVILIDEANDSVQNNTILNVYDAAIEGIDSVQGTRITGNTIANAGVDGIASYWCTAWRGNTVSTNDISRSPVMMEIYYQTGSPCSKVATAGGFSSNQITDNRFRSGAPSGQIPHAMSIVLNTLDPSLIVNNLIRGNDFGGAPGPVLVPQAGFVDGGGNLCIPAGGPFCAGGSVMAANGTSSRARPGLVMNPGLPRYAEPAIAALRPRPFHPKRSTWR
jgi:hypothetical protein